MISEKTIEIIKSLQLQCDITGKINGLSFYKWKGNNVYRRIGKPCKPASEAQLECRKKFATLQNLSKLFKPIIQATYNTGKKPLTPANLFIKRNGIIFNIDENRTQNEVPSLLRYEIPMSIGVLYRGAQEKEENSKVKLTSNRSYFEGLSMTTYSKTNCLPEQSRRVTDTVELNSNRSWFDSAHHTDSSNNDNLNFNLGLIPENWTITLKSWGTFLLLGERCFALPTCYL